MGEKLAYLLEEATEATGLSRTKLYAAHRAGEIKFLKAGHRTLIRREELIRYLGTLPKH